MEGIFFVFNGGCSKVSVYRSRSRSRFIFKLLFRALKVLGLGCYGLCPKIGLFLGCSKEEKMQY